ncbi:MAG: hemolysin family protein [Bacteroidota bacterium]|nr:hemolysin family protein [Bacteroidota bacterium]
MLQYYLSFLILSLAISAFFSGLEIAFYQAKPLKIELDRKQGKTSAKLLSYFIDHPSNFITNTLIGNNIALVIYGMIFTKIFEYIYPDTGIFGITIPIVSFFVLTLISTIIILIFAEFLPKALFLINPNRILNILAIPYWIIFVTLYPINLIISYTSKGILRIPGIKIKDKKQSFDFYDLFSYLSEQESENLDETENIELDKQMIKNVIDLPNVKVRECLVPRPEIKAVSVNESLSKIKQIFINTGHSKILIYKEDIDNIIGYVHMIDIFGNPKSLNDILRPIIIIVESMPANKLLKLFTENRRSLGLVVDEFGGTAGLVTIEDVLEEIFGEIEDEHDKEHLKEVKIDDRKFVFSARHEIDYLNEKYNFELPEGDYETLGGLILHLHENIPTENEIIKCDRFDFKILKATENRINEIQLKIKLS